MCCVVLFFILCLMFCQVLCYNCSCGENAILLNMYCIYKKNKKTNLTSNNLHRATWCDGNCYVPSPYDGVFRTQRMVVCVHKNVIFVFVFTRAQLYFVEKAHSFFSFSRLLSIMPPNSLLL